jgi:hypothetical protein
MVASAQSIPEKKTPNMSTSTLNQLHSALLELHKALLEFEKGKYEALYGKIASPYQYLDLVIKHPAFAWLRTLSEAIVSTDGLDRDDARKQDEEIKTSIKQLLSLTNTQEEFTQKYTVALNQSADVAYAHAKVMQLLS